MRLEDGHLELSSTERHVLQLLLAGRTPKEVAVARSVALSTVRNHISAIHRKLGVSRTHPDAADWAKEHAACCLVLPWERP
jgi:DNA-binding CsgD family transcriptional regulator